MLKFYGYKKCGTSNKAEKKLNELKIAYTFIDITENPPAEPSMKKIVKQSGEEIKKFFNTSGQAYKEPGMKEKIKTMNEAEIIKLFCSNGKIIKRPVVTDGEKATVGFNEEIFVRTWK